MQMYRELEVQLCAFPSFTPQPLYAEEKTQAPNGYEAGWVNSIVGYGKEKMKLWKELIRHFPYTTS
jgi:hypothetical protein